MPKKLSDQEQEAMIAMYLAGRTVEETCAVFGRSTHSLVNALKRRGLKSRKKYIPREAEGSIVDFYLSGKSLAATGRKFGVNKTAISEFLRRIGVVARSKHESRRLVSNALDEGFFSVIDTEEKAYWLGFLSADGHVSRSLRYVKLTLKRSDKPHIEAFRNAVGSNARIVDADRVSRRTGKPCPSSRISLGSCRMARDLNAVGVTPGKTWTLMPWVGPDHLMRHYWRGMVDGDGCLSKNTRRRSWTLMLVGTLAVAKGFADFVGDRTGHPKSPRKPKNKNTWCVAYHGSGLPQTIARILYGDTTVFLPRKKFIADRIEGCLRPGGVFE